MTALLLQLIVVQLAATEAGAYSTGVQINHIFTILQLATTAEMVYICQTCFPVTPNLQSFHTQRFPITQESALSHILTAQYTVIM